MVNLFSDTQTRPTAEMREAIARAEVGDEQRRDDPTTTALEERVAALLGHEAALFLPSGTMCNEIAIRLHIRPGGDEILLGRDTHPLRFEGGAPAALSGAVMTVVEGEAGMFAPEALDGARLLNAVVASGVDAATLARGFDSAWVDFTKGLGAPVGACLAGSPELIAEAWRWKQMIGGAMR